MSVLLAAGPAIRRRLFPAPIPRTPPARTCKFQADPPLYLDVHIPDGPGPHPTALVVHGGAFIAGSRSMSAVRCLVVHLRARGFVVGSVSYRLARPWGARLPEQEADVQAAALAWPAIARSVGGDPARSALIGMSAGGGLALAVMAEAPFQRFVGIYGAYDLDLLPLPWASARLLVGAPRPTWNAHNPLARSRFPQPALIVHGLADPLTPFVHAERLVEARAGLATTLVPLEGAVHGYLQDGPDHPHTRATFAALDTFLEPLQPPGAP